MQIEIESNANKVPGERVVPGSGAHPGVIVVQDGNGSGPHTIGVANEIAEAGFTALAVDLYTREGPPVGCQNSTDRNSKRNRASGPPAVCDRSVG